MFGLGGMMASKKLTDKIRFRNEALRRRELVILLRRRLSEDNFEQIFKRLIDFYEIADSGTYELGDESDFHSSNDVVKILAKAVDMNIASTIAVWLSKPFPSPMWFGRRYIKASLKDARRNIKLTFEEALSKKYPLQLSHITAELDAILGTNKGVIRDLYAQPRDKILIKIATALYLQFEEALKIAIQGTIWEAIIRGQIRLLYTYFYYYLAGDLDNAHLLEALVDRSLFGIPIGQHIDRDKRDSWSVLLEGKKKETKK